MGKEKLCFYGSKKILTWIHGPQRRKGGQALLMALLYLFHPNLTYFINWNGNSYVNHQKQPILSKEEIYLTTTTSSTETKHINEKQEVLGSLGLALAQELQPHKRTQCWLIKYFITIIKIIVTLHKKFHKSKLEMSSVRIETKLQKFE